MHLARTVSRAQLAALVGRTLLRTPFRHTLAPKPLSHAPLLVLRALSGRISSSRAAKQPSSQAAATGRRQAAEEPQTERQRQRQTER